MKRHVPSTCAMANPLSVESGLSVFPEGMHVHVVGVLERER